MAAAAVGGSRISLRSARGYEEENAKNEDAKRIKAEDEPDERSRVGGLGKAEFAVGRSGAQRARRLF
jgi:hypothetical protein